LWGEEDPSIGVRVCGKGEEDDKGEAEMLVLCEGEAVAEGVGEEDMDRDEDIEAGGEGEGETEALCEAASLSEEVKHMVIEFCSGGEGDEIIDTLTRGDLVGLAQGEGVGVALEEKMPLSVAVSDRVPPTLLFEGNRTETVGLGESQVEGEGVGVEVAVDSPMWGLPDEALDGVTEGDDESEPPPLARSPRVDLEARVDDVTLGESEEDGEREAEGENEELRLGEAEGFVEGDGVRLIEQVTLFVEEVDWEEDKEAA